MPHPFSMLSLSPYPPSPHPLLAILALPSLHPHPTLSFPPYSPFLSLSLPSLRLLSPPIVHLPTLPRPRPLLTPLMAWVSPSHCQVECQLRFVLPHHITCMVHPPTFHPTSFLNPPALSSSNHLHGPGTHVLSASMVKNASAQSTSPGKSSLLLSCSWSHVHC